MANINYILSEIKQLDIEEQLNLLEKITLLIRKERQATKDVKLSDIKGVGAELWKNIDVDKYIESEREW